MANTYTQVDLDNVHTALDALSAMITWDETEEGADFWVDISNRIDRIADNIKLHLKPKGPAKL